MVRVQVEPRRYDSKCLSSTAALPPVASEDSNATTVGLSCDSQKDTEKS